MDFTIQEKMWICGGKDSVHHIFYRIYRAMLTGSKEDAKTYMEIACHTYDDLLARHYDKLFDLKIITEKALDDAINSKSVILDDCDFVGIHAETLERLDTIVKKIS